MAEVNFIVSTHLGVIMSNYKNAQAQEGDVKFSALTEEVFGIFDLLQLTSILNIFKTDDEALADFE
jgi:anti-anti-sigma regulatory factor